jgi:hypothetical protein
MTLGEDWISAELHSDSEVEKMNLISNLVKFITFPSTRMNYEVIPPDFFLVAYCSAQHISLPNL